MESLTENQIKKIKKNTPILIGERIRFLRNQLGLTQTELSELVLKDRQYLYKIEKGIVTPNISTITILSKAMEIPLKEFFDIEN
ncbi:helix-turn-helix domain-containing protein [Tenacibaculum soleae]|uniref:helix-turn-helix domain-containing protein n=1 Tax=Tenacibaculum soleae TaxID=447689 RepID=UPI0026E23A86|nr:helix-turn-helix transcriptional regulator [Tenacibaculum soleae]MDO6813230.1 helix-turn-helix transcriptional regulator [Tenacibaculum soleae]